jgi:hypothetical protein
MFTWSKLAVCLVCAWAAVAQDVRLDSPTSVRVNLPSDSPLSLLSANFGESRASARGGAMVLDLHMQLSLRNSGPARVRGVTLLVTAQEVTPGGKASVAVPSLNVASGEVFPIRIDLRLLRPLQPDAAGPLVEIALDGVLFDNFGFYGPNRLNSRRSMVAWEMEAQRDREYFKSVLRAGGPSVLQQEVLQSLNRQADRPRLNVQVSRAGRAVSGAAPDRTARFAFVRLPGSPVEPESGWAEIAGNEARAPEIQVRNVSPEPVRYVEIGWVVKDDQGREFMAASVPAVEKDILLRPGTQGRVLQTTRLKFSRGGGDPVSIRSMTGFVSQVEYADGRVWIPSRAALRTSSLLGVIAPSPEEQRLTDLYRKKGLQVLLSELEKF